MPSASAPTSALPSAAQLNCSVPNRAEALPARAGWRDSAPTAALGNTSPVQASATAAGMKTPSSPPKPVRAVTASTATALAEVRSVKDTTRREP